MHGSPLENSAWEQGACLSGRELPWDGAVRWGLDLQLRCLEQGAALLCCVLGAGTAAGEFGGKEGSGMAGSGTARPVLTRFLPLARYFKPFKLQTPGFSAGVSQDKLNISAHTATHNKGKEQVVSFTHILRAKTCVTSVFQRAASWEGALGADPAHRGLLEVPARLGELCARQGKVHSWSSQPHPPLLPQLLIPEQRGPCALRTDSAYTEGWTCPGAQGRARG